LLVVAEQEATVLAGALEPALGIQLLCAAPGRNVPRGRDELKVSFRLC
jgi:hypothetical protein